MVQHVGRKILLIAALLAASVLSLTLMGFRLGLDLQGGTRLVYTVPFEEALAEGTITEAEFNDRRGLIDQMISIWKTRLDPQGVREPNVHAEGTDRIVIELPGSGSEVRKEIDAPLGEDVEPGSRTISLGGTDAERDAFPSGGGVIEIGSETIHYRKRQDAVLTGCTRAYSGTERAAHATGERVHLKNIDPWRELIENVGDLNFYIAAKSADLANAGTDLASEKAKVETWIENNPDVEVDAFNRLAFEDGGPWERLRWFPDTSTDPTRPLAERIQALIIEEDPRWRFSGDDLKSVFQTQDELGFPAVGFEMSTSKREDFGDFTGAHEGERMAIVINGEIVTFPVIEARLPGHGIITGGISGFTNDEVQELITVLRSGSLKIKPILEHQERVGATLGDDYVERGALSGILGLVAVLVFVLIYYRRLGLIAATSLVVNLVLLTGALAFVQATLTLPGVAGIILTVGMAVDANILIYERIREEAARGRKPLQAAKDGFANALSTIVDANLTTLITAVILYMEGTGPVRGFATTLSIGILTSMFSALVVTRVLVHLWLEKGVETFKMARLVGDTHIRFISKWKIAVVLSSIAIVGGVALFVSLPDNRKLGIDFLGGVTLTVRTEQPQDVQKVRDMVGSIPGVIGRSAEVKAVLASGGEGVGYQQFRVTFKTDAQADDAAEAIKDTVENEVRSVLAGVLEKGPYDVRLEGTSASGTLYFERSHPDQDVATVLRDQVGLQDVTVERVVGPSAAYSFRGTAPLDRDLQTLSDLVERRFEGAPDSRGVEFAWAEPIPEVALVGAQVVSEIRDKAIFAILLSLFAVVMYIRVRFAEYSYGYAAVVALVHDVLITLGALAVAIEFDLFEAEINLPMIAAFLTIIGYSLNDTIVIFDRVRENLPRTKGTLTEIIDLSLNQTLSRTLLTSATTLATVLILLVFNFGTRNVLEGFAYALTVGIVVGTYSTVYVASPVLLWLEGRRLKGGDGSDSRAKGTKKARPAVQTS